MTDRLEQSLNPDELVETPNGHAVPRRSSPVVPQAPAHDGKPGPNPARIRVNSCPSHRQQRNGAMVYGALDLGTNNCRLLVARPSRRGFQVIDAFSRIIRLGEGVSQTGKLSDAAIERTIDALKGVFGQAGAP